MAVCWYRPHRPLPRQHAAHESRIAAHAHLKMAANIDFRPSQPTATRRCQPSCRVLLFVPILKQTSAIFTRGNSSPTPKRASEVGLVGTKRLCPQSPVQSQAFDAEPTRNARPEIVDFLCADGAVRNRAPSKRSVYLKKQPTAVKTSSGQSTTETSQSPSSVSSCRPPPRYDCQSAHRRTLPRPAPAMPANPNGRW